MDIGARIRKTRQASGMSQATLAEQAGLSQPSICRVEAGKQQLRLVELVRIATALGTTAAALMGDEARAA